MRICKFIVGCALSFPLAAFALDPVGTALAEGVTSTLVRRGFLSTDPRVLQTLASMGVRTGVNVAAVGSGATWLSVAARLTPYAAGAILVGQGINWWFDIQGKAYLAPPGSVTTAPVFSNGVVAGQLCWGISGDCFGSPQEVLAFMFSSTKAQYPGASYGVPQLVSNSPTQWTATYNYSIPEIHLNNYSGTKVIVSHTANVSCAQGYGYSSSGSTPNACVSAGLANSPYAGAPVLGTTLQAAYDALPATTKAALMSPELATEIASRVWKDASLQSGYQGVPFDTANPPQPGDFTGYQISSPTTWPKTSDLASPVSTVTNPISQAKPNPNQVQTDTTGSTKIDLGPDPGTPMPQLDDAPTDLFKPVSDAVAPLLSWRVPAHSSACPNWQASPVIAGHVFAIDVSYHCTIADQYRTLIQGIAAACFAIMAVFIILDA